MSIDAASPFLPRSNYPVATMKVAIQAQNGLETEAMAAGAALVVYDEVAGVGKPLTDARGIKARGEVKVATAVPALTAASAYASGNVLGGKYPLAAFGREAGGTGLLQSLTVFSKSAQTMLLDLLLFHTDPINSAFTDKTPLALNLADFDKMFDVVQLSGWISLGTPSLVRATQLALPYELAAGATSAYVVPVTRSTPTFTAADDLKIAARVLRN